MSDTFEEDMARGCLSTGEPLEAAYGQGWWSDSNPDPEPDWNGAECPYCHKEALYDGLLFVECTHCGKKQEDIGGPMIPFPF